MTHYKRTTRDKLTAVLIGILATVGWGLICILIGQ